MKRILLILAIVFVFASCDDNAEPLTEDQIKLSHITEFETNPDTVIMIEVEGTDGHGRHLIKDGNGNIRSFVERGNTDLLVVTLGGVTIFIVVIFILAFLIGYGVAKD